MFKKEKKLWLLIMVIMITQLSGQAQGAFQNLDFESANIVSLGVPDPRLIQYAPAFPGWSTYFSTNLAKYALHNAANLDESGIAIVDQNWTNNFLGFSVIDGNFSALIMAGLSPEISPVPADTTLSQMGLVPADAKSLFFKEKHDGPQTFAVSLGGQFLTLVPLLVEANWTLYGADIQNWAGQTAELSFNVIAQRPHFLNNYFLLDSIEFSSITIPEPRGFALMGLGVGFWLLKRGTWIRKRRD